MADAMHEGMLDARQEGGSYRRIEVITGQRRRRQWTAEEKARVVPESFEEGANISEVARRHGVVRGLLTVWRRQFGTTANFPAPAVAYVFADGRGAKEITGQLTGFSGILQVDGDAAYKALARGHEACWFSRGSRSAAGM